MNLFRRFINILNGGISTPGGTQQHASSSSSSGTASPSAGYIPYAGSRSTHNFRNVVNNPAYDGQRPHRSITLSQLPENSPSNETSTDDVDDDNYLSVHHGAKNQTILDTTTLLIKQHSVIRILPSQSSWCMACQEIIEIDRSTPCYRCTECHQIFHLACVTAALPPAKTDTVFPTCPMHCNAETSAQESQPSGFEMVTSAAKNLWYSIAFVDPDSLFDGLDGYYSSDDDDDWVGKPETPRSNSVSSNHSVATSRSVSLVKNNYASITRGFMTLTRNDLQSQISEYNRRFGDVSLTWPDAKNVFHGCLEFAVLLLTSVSVRDKVTQAEHIRKFPLDSSVKLNIASNTHANTVISQILHELGIVSPTASSFALYEQTLDPKSGRQLKLRRLHVEECPLYLCLSWLPVNAGEENEVKSNKRRTKRFTLQENQAGDITWEGFADPELNGMLAFLDNEEANERQSLEVRYTRLKLAVIRRLKTAMESVEDDHLEPEFEELLQNNSSVMLTS